LALAGLDVGTSFGGIGSSREMMFATLAEPAMLMAVFTLSLFAGSTELSSISAFMLGPHAGLNISLALALVALIIVAIAENARIPVDNPATHLELTMVHEAMVLEYSGRHLALIEAAASVKLLLYLSLIACVFIPWGTAVAGAGLAAQAVGFATYAVKLLILGFLLSLFETAIAKMRVFRVPEFLGVALIPVALHRIVVRLGIHRTIEAVVSIGPTMLIGMALVALAIVVMLPVTATEGVFVREDLAFALSVLLLGLLMMITRRNAVSQ